MQRSSSSNSLLLFNHTLTKRHLDCFGFCFVWEKQLYAVELQISLTASSRCESNWCRYSLSRWVFNVYIVYIVYIFQYEMGILYIHCVYISVWDGYSICTLCMYFSMRWVFYMYIVYIFQYEMGILYVHCVYISVWDGYSICTLCIYFCMRWVF